jgi:hypothetical protein
MLAEPPMVPYAVIVQVDGTPIDRYCNASLPALDDRTRLVLKLCEAVQFAAVQSHLGPSVADYRGCRRQ